MREKRGALSYRLKNLGVHLMSLGCDGWIDALVSIWLEDGINTLFFIAVGAWVRSIGLWREQYGKELRGVGG